MERLCAKCQRYVGVLTFMDYEGDEDDEDRIVSGNPEPDLCVLCIIDLVVAGNLTREDVLEAMEE